MTYDYPFTEEESQAAYDCWGANCGPNSLAFALQVKLEAVRHAIPGFEEKLYTSPTMMKAALANLKTPFVPILSPNKDGILEPAAMFHETISLVRIQWTGPWTKPGANAKWAYRQTHWIATWATREAGDFLELKRTTIGLFVFDCNGGICSFKSWQEEIVPALTAAYPRADGGWFPTHVWRIT